MEWTTMFRLPTVGALSTRRLILLATVANLGVGALVLGTYTPQALPSLIAPAHAAESAQRMPGFADLVEKVKPAVISVRVKTEGAAQMMSFDGTQSMPNSGEIEKFLRRFGMPNLPGMGDKGMGENPAKPEQRRPVTGKGSGFFITADGYAVTNHHVIDKAKSVEITTDDGKRYDAKVIGSDERTDLALIKVDGRSDFAFVKLADKAARVGDWVVAIGNPFGLGGTVTAGIVSAHGRDIGAGPYDDFIQIDAPINKGNSGGPTFDMDGNVIGVNTAIFSPSGGSVGIGFAVPAETVKSVVAQLKDKGVVSRGWLGVQIQPVTADIAESLGMKGSDGALVAEPQADSPAVKAGILAGDVVTAVNGRAVKDAREFARMIGAMAPGEEAKLTIWRKGAETSVAVKLGELPKEHTASAAPEQKSAGTEMPKLGLML